MTLTVQPAVFPDFPSAIAAEGEDPFPPFGFFDFCFAGCFAGCVVVVVPCFAGCVVVVVALAAEGIASDRATHDAHDGPASPRE